VVAARPETVSLVTASAPGGALSSTITLFLPHEVLRWLGFGLVPALVVRTLRPVSTTARREQAVIHRHQRPGRCD
jgi:hypothetical protein